MLCTGIYSPMHSSVYRWFYVNDRKSTIAFSGKDSAKRASDKLNLMLRWLWRWKFSDHYVLGKLWGVGYRSVMSTVSSYEKKGLIARIKGPGMPSHVYYLKELGAEHAAQLMAESRWIDMKPAIYVSRLGLKQVQHDLAVQYLILKLEKESKEKTGSGIEVINDRQLRFNNNLLFNEGKKIPDALIRYKNGDLFAIEMVESMYETQERKRVLWLHAEARAHNKIKGTIYASTIKSYLRLIQSAANADCGSWKYLKDKKKWINDPKGIKYVNKEYLKESIIFIDMSKYRSKLYTG